MYVLVILRPHLVRYGTKNPMLNKIRILNAPCRRAVTTDTIRGSCGICKGGSSSVLTSCLVTLTVAAKKNGGSKLIRDKHYNFREKSEQEKKWCFFFYAQFKIKSLHLINKEQDN